MVQYHTCIKQIGIDLRFNQSGSEINSQMERAVRRTTVFLKHVVFRHSVQMTSRDYTAGIIGNDDL